MTAPDLTALLSAAAMSARPANSYPPDTYVVELAELRQIIREMLQNEQATSSK
jgi:hypothetical protein